MDWTWGREAGKVKGDSSVFSFSIERMILRQLVLEKKWEERVWEDQQHSLVHIRSLRSIRHWCGDAYWAA